MPFTPESKPRLSSEGTCATLTIPEDPRLLPVIDVEKQNVEKPVESVDSNSLNSSTADPFLVAWDGDEDPGHPYNWSKTLRWTITFLTSFGGLVTMMSGAMIAPALPDLARDLMMTEADANLSLSVFILAFAFGPLLLAPFSELYGRRPVWLLAGVWYSLWSVVCGFSHNKAVLVVGRLLSGFGGSVDFVIAWPVLCDIWKPEHRGQGIAISGYVPLLGPALGPVLGGVVTNSIGWRWVFWIAAIFNALLIIVALFFFPETSATIILRKKAKKLSKDTGKYHYVEADKQQQSLRTKLLTAITRPTRMLLTQPILWITSLFGAYSFGVLYLFLSSFSSLYTERYHQSTAVSGLHYISLGIGYVFGAQFGGMALDAIWARLTARASGATAPEYRVPLLIPGGFLLPIGLLWYGWSAEARLHWIVPDIGVFVLGLGFILSFNAIAAYLMDTFPGHTASAIAANQFWRMLFGFIFPIFAPAMFSRLGWGWTNTVLACIAMVSSICAPVVLWKWGPKLRAMGKLPK